MLVAFCPHPNFCCGSLRQGCCASHTEVIITHIGKGQPSYEHILERNSKDLGAFLGMHLSSYVNDKDL
jgi:hypothetical protein